MALEPQKLRDSSLDELIKEEKELRDQMWKLQLQKSTGQVQDPHKMREVRRDLARVLTVRREQEIASAKGRA
jgi:large subunit ribosomal protein L29